jgi:NTP pyrophosphatase (non-canonical NTP hydrolase)
MRNIKSNRGPMPATGFVIDKTALQVAGNVLAEQCHGVSHACGWWHDLTTNELLDRNVGELLCLVHSELSEGMEGSRKDLMDDKLPHRTMLEVELADAVIRIGDLCGALGLDLGGAIAEKMAFNQTRLDHMAASRLGVGGKQF